VIWSRLIRVGNGTRHAIGCEKVCSCVPPPLCNRWSGGGALRLLQHGVANRSGVRDDQSTSQHDRGQSQDPSSNQGSTQPTVHGWKSHAILPGNRRRRRRRGSSTCAWRSYWRWQRRGDRLGCLRRARSRRENLRRRLTGQHTETKYENQAERWIDRHAPPAGSRDDY
jgi:hypothetical protein